MYCCDVEGLPVIQANEPCSALKLLERTNRVTYNTGEDFYGELRVTLSEASTECVAHIYCNVFLMKSPLVSLSEASGGCGAEHRRFCNQRAAKTF